MRPKKTHAEPIQPVTDGERQGFLYRWNTGETQVMWLSTGDFEALEIAPNGEGLQHSITVSEL